MSAKRENSYETVKLDESPLTMGPTPRQSRLTSLVGGVRQSVDLDSVRGTSRFSLVQMRKKDFRGRRRSNTDPSVKGRQMNKRVQKVKASRQKKKKWALKFRLFGCKRESFSDGDVDQEESIVGILREQLKHFEEHEDSQEEEEEGEEVDGEFEEEASRYPTRDLWDIEDDEEEEGEDTDYVMIESPKEKKTIERIVYDNGSKYIGSVDDRGRRHGRGKLTFASGDIYDGEWMNGSRHGNALCMYAGSRKISNFSTHFELNEPSSRYLTHISYTNGDKYIGNVKMISERINTSIVHNAPRAPVQTKALELILRHGRGEMYWARTNQNGPNMMRKNRRNNRNGNDEKNSNSKKSNTMRFKYSGNWENDHMSGWGVCIYKCSSCPSLRSMSPKRLLNRNPRRRIRMQAEEYYYGEWKRSRREGNGLQVYYDGSLYEGEWKQDRRYGKGIFQLSSGDTLEGVWRGDNLKNGTFHKGSVKSASTTSTFILHHHLQQRLREDSSFQHLSEVTYPENRLLSRRKWVSFFGERRLEERVRSEKKRVSGTVFYSFFAQKKDSLIRGKPNFDKFNHQSFVNYVYQDLQMSMRHQQFEVVKDKNLSSGSNGSSSSSSGSSQSLSNLERQRSVSIPVGINESSLRKDALLRSSKTQGGLEQGGKARAEHQRLLREGGFLHIVSCEFRDYFNFRYSTISPESCHVQLPFALDDVFSFISQLNRICVDIYTPEIVKTFGVKRLFSVIKQYILSRIYKFLFELYKFKYSEFDSKFAFKLKSISQINIRELGCKENYIPSSSLFAEPYERVFDKFRELTKQHCPAHKFAVLVDVHKEILTAMEIIDKESKERGADEIFPVYLYCFIKANIPNVYSQFRFMLDFSDAVVHNSEIYYRFTNFENGLNYIDMLDNRVRDRGGCLITPSVLLQRMEFAIDQIQRERKRSKKTTISLAWLSGSLIKISNHYKLEKGVVIDFNDFFHYIEESGFDYVELIFQLLGLRLRKANKKSKELKMFTSQISKEEEVEGEDGDDDEIPENPVVEGIKMIKKPLSWTDMDTKVFSKVEEDELVRNAEYTYEIVFDHAYPGHVYYQVASNLDLIL